MCSRELTPVVQVTNRTDLSLSSFNSTVQLLAQILSYPAADVRFGQQNISNFQTAEYLETFLLSMAEGLPAGSSQSILGTCRSDACVVLMSHRCARRVACRGAPVNICAAHHLAVE